MRRPVALLIPLGLACALAVIGLAPAQALRTTGWASWEPLTGSANDFSTTMQLPAKGFPAASVASDSRAGSVGVQSGASVWYGANTPVGDKYGSSRDRPYLNLRPVADTASAPSTTTYTFEHPTPPTGWTFVLGDIDADKVQITAKDADGQEVDAAQLGFTDAFNLCDSTPRPSACSASVGDVPTWHPGTQTLSGNQAANDTVGASGWFEPNVSLSSLTFVFTRRSGFPVYQTWFASVARTISGTVTDVSGPGRSCPVDQTTVHLVGPDGEALATTTPDATGAYSFGELATRPAYVVSIEQPETCSIVGAESHVVSNAAGNATADFDVHQTLPQPISGRVTADGTDPLAEVTVTLHLPGGGTRTTTTEADGSYLFDDNALGNGYFVSIDVPTGYQGNAQRPPFNLAQQVITGQDFDLTANPNLSGRVTGAGDGLGGVTVTLTPSGGGPAVTTVTQGDGTYQFDRVPSGTYDVSVEPPPGFDPEPLLAGVVVAANDLVDQDFALSRPGSVAGRVHLDDASGQGEQGVEIRVTGPEGEHTLTTDAQGDYFEGDLPAGTDEIRVVVPPGFDGVGPAEHTVTITDAGEIHAGQDFVITRTATTTGPSPGGPSSSTSAPTTAPTTATSSPTTGPTGGDLPNTGSDVSLPVVLLGAGLLAVGLVLIAATGFGGRRRRH